MSLQYYIKFVKYTNTAQINVYTEIHRHLDELCKLVIRVSDTGVGISNEEQKTYLNLISNL